MHWRGGFHCGIWWLDWGGYLAKANGWLRACVGNLYAEWWWLVSYTDATIIFSTKRVAGKHGRRQCVGNLCDGRFHSQSGLKNCQIPKWRWWGMVFKGNLPPAIPESSRWRWLGSGYWNIVQFRPVQKALGISVDAQKKSSGLGPRKSKKGPEVDLFF